MIQALPSLFLSHGAPDILLSEHGVLGVLREWAADLPRPRAIVIVSAHWMDDPVGITAGERLQTLHDFGGFPAELYARQYPAGGDPVLSEDVARRLQQQGLDNRLHKQRGLDHGAWIPLTIMYPEADIPVVQVSLPAGSLHDLVAMGRALGPLRRQEVLIIGSGGSVHNLRALKPAGQNDDWAVQFEQWLGELVEGNHFKQLLTANGFPAIFRQAHPTLEHFAPLVVAWAAGNPDRPGRRIHHGFSYGNLGMSCFEFGRQTATV